MNYLMTTPRFSYSLLVSALILAASQQAFAQTAHDHAAHMQQSSELQAANAASTSTPAAHEQHATGESLVPYTELSAIVATTVNPQSPLNYVTSPKIPRQPIPASDGTDYLKTIPGFTALRNGGTNGDPVLRGMFGSRINILTNNSSMPGACGGRMDNPGSYIAPENFDELSVIKGPQTVLWGPIASAGTVRFVRNAPELDADGEVQFEGSLTGGSFGRHDQNADLTVGNDKFYARLSANHSHSQDYKDGDGNRIHSKWDKWNADLTLGLKPDQNTLFEVNAGVGDGRVAYATRGMDGTMFKRTTYGLRFKKENMGGVLDAIEAELYYNQADHNMDNYRMRPYKMRMESNPRRTTWGGRLAGTLKFNEQWSLITGVDFQESKHELRRRVGNIGAKEMPWNDNAKFSNQGIFGELTWAPSDYQRVITGIRFDHATAKDLRAMSASSGYKRSDTLFGGFMRYEHDLQSSPTTLYVGLGHTERFPDFWELVSPGKGPAGSVNAFTGIKPEKTTQLDFGAQYNGDNLQAWFSGYFGYVNDFILFDYSGMGVKGVRNVKARIMGAELGADYALNDNFKIGASLAYAWGKNRDDGRPMAQMPPLEARLSASYDDGTWSAGAVWRLVAAQKRYAANQGNVVSKDFGPSAGFGTLSLNGSYAFNKSMKLSVGIDNVFNKTYSEHLNLAGQGSFGFAANTRVNEPGRNIWARLDIRY